MSAPMRLVIAIALIVAAPVNAQPLAAQTTATTNAASAGETPPQASVDDLKALHQTLSDPAEREAFLNRLDTLIKARQESGAGDGDAAQELARLGESAFGRLAREAGELATALGALPERLDAIARELRDPRTWALWLEQGLRIMAALLAAMIAGIVARLPVRAVHGRLAGDTVASWGWWFALAAVRVIAVAIPPIAFVAAGYVASGLLTLTEPAAAVAVAFIVAVGATRLVTNVSREILATATQPSTYALSSDAADYLRRWITRLAGLSAYGIALIHSLDRLGLAEAATSVLYKTLAILVSILGIILVTRNRTAVAAVIRGEHPRGSARGRLADIWHLFASVLILGATIAFAAGSADDLVFMARSFVLTLATFAVTVVLALGVIRGLRRVTAAAPGQTRGAPPPVVERLVAAAIYAIGLLVLLEVWGLEGLGWLTTELGRQLGGTVISVAVTVVLAIAALQVVTRLVERALSSDVGSSARKQTLLPLARNVLRVVVVGIAMLMILADLGVNIGPLLAGAGVIGLAVGFGAQTLVQDLITGFFMLIEDTVSVGDWVNLGSHAGTVESLSIRSIRLRDLEGSVHTVPFSQVSTVVNMTREFSYALLDVGVAYREDVDAVVGVLHEIAAELSSDETFGELIIADLEVLGVERFAASSVDIRVRLRTRPGAHWRVRREFQRRIKYAFDERDIEIPFPHQTLYFGADHDGQAQPAHLRLERSDETPIDGVEPEHSAETRPDTGRPRTGRDGDAPIEG